MVRGFSRVVPFLFLGLLRAPMRNSPERVRDTIWTFPEKVGNPPVWKHPGLASLNIRADFWEGDATKHFSVKKKGFSVKRREAIQWMRGLVRIPTGKAIQWRGPGDSVNRRTLKTEKLLSSSPSQKSALNSSKALTAIWKALALRFESCNFKSLPTGGDLYAAPIGAFFCPEIRAFSVRFLQPFPKSFVTVKYYSNTKMAVNSR